MSTQNFNVETGLIIGNVVANAAANSLTTSGNITAGNLTANILLSTVNLSVTGVSNLGSVGNITITGGANGQYLQTNGSGNISWVNATSTGTVNSGTANQLAYYSTSGNTISTAGANLTWNGANLLTIIGNAAVGNISVTSNASVGNIGATAAVITANATFGNINSVSGILSVSGNANVGNIGTNNAVISANATFGNINSVSGILSVSGNANVGNIGAFGAYASYLSASGNANVGNLNSAGNANVLNVYTTNVVATTGNFTGNMVAGNVLVGNITISTDTISSSTSNITIDPSGVGVGGNVIIAGNLQVTGTTTSINSVTLTVSDINFTLAKDATTSAQADGGGITVAGANAQITYSNTGDQWLINKSANVAGNITGSGILSITGNANVGNIGASGGSISGNLYVGRIGTTSGAAYALPTGDGSNGSVLATYGNSQTYWTSVATNGTLGQALTSNGAGGFGTAVTLATVATSGSASDLSAGTLAAARMPALTGDVTTTVGTVATTVSKINGTTLSGLATGLLKNTTATGVPSIAVAGTDFIGGVGNLTTVGSVPYVSASGTLDQDAGQFFWDATNNRLGIGTATPAYALDVLGGLNTSDVAASQYHTTYATGVINNFGANNFLAFQSAGAEKMRISSTGNVGIGTNAPGLSLDVNGVIRAASEANAINTINIGLVVQRTTNDSQLAIGYKATPDAWIIGSSYNTTGAYKPIAFATSDVERMRILANGNVGIGTTSPGEKLHVSGGNILLDNTYSLKFKNSAGTAVNILNVSSADNVTLSTPSGGDLYLNQSSYLVVKSTGSVGIGAVTPSNKLTVVGSMSVGSATYNTAAPTNGMIIEGNVGIGTTSPSAPLQVVGADGFSIPLKLTQSNDGAGTEVTNIGFGSALVAEGANIVKAGIGLRRTNSFGRGFLDIYVNNTADTSDISATNVVSLFHPTGLAITTSTTAPYQGFQPLTVRGGSLFVASAIAGAFLQLWKDEAGTSGAPTKAVAVGMSQSGGSPGNDLFLNTFDGTSWASRMTVLNASGNVGIGTTTPANLLDIATPLGSGFGFDSPGHLPTLKFYRYAGGASTIGAYQLVVGETGASAGSDLSFKSGGYAARGSETITTKVTFTNTGNVGIGTTTPSTFLHVSDSTNTPAVIARFQNTSISGGPILQLDRPAVERVTALQYSTAGVAEWSVGIFRDGGNSIKKYAINLGNDYLLGTASKLVIDIAGNVGIGNTSPVNTLSVTGSMYVSGNAAVGNISATSIVGTLTTASQTNITSVGTLGSLNVTGNITGGNLIGTLASGTSNITITSSGNVSITSAGAANVLVVTGTGANIAGTLNVTGNVGIGTTTPVYDIDIYRNSSVVGLRVGNSFGTMTVGPYTLTSTPNSTASAPRTNMYFDLNSGNGGAIGSWIFNNGAVNSGVLKITNSGSLIVGSINTSEPVDNNFKLEVAKSGSAGTARFYDQTASTGSTLAVFRAGAGQSTNDLTQWQNNAGTALSVVTSAGWLGIGTTSPAYALDVTGTIRSSAGILNTTNTFEKVFSSVVNFPNAVANQAVDIRLGNLAIGGYIEVELTSTYSNQASYGKLTKLFAIGTNPNNAIYTNESRVSDALGSVADNVAIGDISWDATNSVYRIPISHIVSTGNQYTIKVRMFSESGLAKPVFDAMTVSSIYTLTALSRNYVNYNGNVGIGTTTPTAKLHVYGGNLKQDDGAYNLLISSGSTITGSNHIIVDAAASYLQLKSTSNSIFFTQNSVNSFYSDSVGAVVNTLYLKQGNVGIGTATPGSILALGGTAARIFGMDRNTTAATAGQGFTISSGGAIAGTANLAGGDLTLKSGISTGTGSSAIRFFTATAAGTGTADNAPTEKVTILHNGNVGIGTATPIVSLDVLSPTATATVAILKRGLQYSDSNLPTTFGNPYLQLGGGEYKAGHLISIGFQTSGSQTAKPSAEIGAVNVYNSANTYSALVFGTRSVTTDTTVSERMRIDQNGNVGIGTASPQGTLHLQKSTAGAVGPILAINNAATSTLLNESQIAFLTDAGASVSGIANARLKVVNQNAANGAVSLQLYTWDGSAEAARLYIKEDGSIGLGTTTPTYELDVGKSAGSGTARFYDQTASTGSTLAVFRAGAGQSTNDLTQWQNNAGTVLSRVTSAGWLGIGTTTPSKLLHVAGDALINTMTVGLGAGSIATNTAVGFESLALNTTGYYNTALGYRSSVANTTGPGNTALGAYTLYANTTGSNTTAVGYGALTVQSTATYNTSVGYLSSSRTTTGDANTALGAFALYFNTTGGGSTAVGYQAMSATTTGVATFGTIVGGSAYTNGTYTAVQLTYSSGTTAATYPTATIVVAGGVVTSVTLVTAGTQFQNTTTVMTATAASIGGTGSGFTVAVATLIAGHGTAVGYLALLNNTTGGYNTALGFQSQYTATTASYNTSVGYGSLQTNTGGNNTAVGDRSLYNQGLAGSNTAFGQYSGYTNSTGSFNTFIGTQASYYNTTGANNTSVGYNALQRNSTGGSNTAVGYQAGYYYNGVTGNNLTPSNSVYIGNNTSALADGQTNQIVIGDSAIGAGSNTATLGNTAIVTTILRGNVGIGTTSPCASLQIGAAVGYNRTSPAIAVPVGLGGFKELIEFGSDSRGGGLTGYQDGSGLVRVSLGTRTSSTVSEQFSVLNSGNVGIGTITPGSILALGGTAARIFGMDRNTTAATAGQGFTISSGGAIAGTADLAGGDLTLKSGISTGTGSSAIRFFTATAAGTGTTDNAPTEKVTILHNGNVGIGTASPGALLQVGSGTYPFTVSSAGVIKSGTTDSNGSLNIRQPGNGNQTFIIQRATDTAPTGAAFGVLNHSNSAFLYYLDVTGNTSQSGILTVSGTGNSSIAGNTGIGTTAPNVKLDVLSGTVNTAADSLTASTMTVTGPNVVFGAGANNAGVLNVETNTALGIDVGGSIGFGGRYTGTAQAQWALIKGAKENATDGDYASYLAFGTRIMGGQVTERVRINSTGNVGIGISSPTAKLHVAGGKILLDNTQGIQIKDAAGTARTVLQVDGGDNLYLDSTAAGGDLFFRASGNDKLTIKGTSGNVGIGTTTPTSKLAVNGNVSIGLPSSITTNYGQLEVRRASSDNRVTAGFTTDTNYQTMGWLPGTDMRVGFEYSGQYHQFKVHNGSAGLTDALYIQTTTGNVGIGTTSPGNKLAIVGSGAVIRITGTNDTSAVYTQFNTSNVSGLGYFGVEGSTAGATLTNTLAYATFISAGSSGSALQLGTPGGIRATILANGNVGIGTTSPGASLQVNGGANNGTKNTVGIFGRPDNTTRVEVGTGDGSSNSGFVGSASNHPFYFTTNSTEKMRIDTNGNVGIGTTAPIATLHVKGGQGVPSLTADTNNITTVQSSTNAELAAGAYSTSPYAIWLQVKDSTNTGASYPLTLNPLGGNVGIGTTSPNSTLTVAGTCNVTGVLTGRTNVTVQATSLNPVVAQTTYIVTATGITLTLPASPTTGDRIGFQPASSSINSYTIARNGNTIMGLLSDFTVNSSAPFDLIYTGSGWVGANGAVSLQNLTGYSYNFYL